jgi:hypothetical protein
MKLQALALAFLVACATTSPFTGPVDEKPTLTITYMRHVVQDIDPRNPPRVETLATANVGNPSNHAMHVVLDCTNSLASLDIEPRTVAHVLLDPKDDSCVLR